MAYSSTFSIEDHQDKKDRAATFNQCRGLAARWSKDKAGNMNWVKQKRIQATLWANSQAGKLSFSQAHMLFNKTKVPAKYIKQINAYLESKKVDLILAQGE